MTDDKEAGPPDPVSLTLTLILSGRAYDERLFERFKRLRLGRSPECEVRLDNLGVSRLQAEIRNEEGVIVLHDLGAGTTCLNGVRVVRHALNNGDVISVGKFTIGVALPRPKYVLGAPRSRVGGLTLAGSASSQEVAKEAAVVHGYVHDPGRPDEPYLLTLPYHLFSTEADLPFRVSGGLFKPSLVAALAREDHGFRLLDVTAKGDEVQVNGAPVTDARLADGDALVVRSRRLKFRMGRPTRA